MVLDEASTVNETDAQLDENDDSASSYHHPASPELFAAVAAMWAHASADDGASEDGAPAPPPLYPMILHLAVIDPTAAYGNDTKPEDVPDDVIPHAAEFLMTSMRRLRQRGTLLLRKVLSRDNNPPIEKVIASGATPRLAGFLDVAFDGDFQLQFEAAWALTNVASGTSEHTLHVTQLPDFITNVIRLIHSSRSDLAEQCVWCVGNIAGDSPRLRDVLLDRGAGVAMTHISLNSTPRSLSALRNTVWAQSNLCRGKPLPPLEHVQLFVPVFASLVSHSDVEIAADALWGLSYLTEREGMMDALMAIDGALPRVFAAMQVGSDALLTPALRIAGNFCTGNKAQTCAATELGLMQAMPTLLSHAKRGIRKEAAWTLSNILADDPKYIGLMLNLNVFPAVLQAAQAAEVEVRKEAMWCIANAANDATPVDVQGMLAAGVVPVVCQSLQQFDAKMILIALEALEHLLAKAPDDTPAAIEACGGVKVIEDLQNHQHNEVFTRAQGLLQTYFEAEAKDPQTNNSAQFHFEVPTTHSDAAYTF